MVKIYVGVYSIAHLSPKLCTIDVASRPGRIIRWGTGPNPLAPSDIYIYIYIYIYISCSVPFKWPNGH